MGKLQHETVLKQTDFPIKRKKNSITIKPNYQDEAARLLLLQKSMQLPQTVSKHLFSLHRLSFSEVILMTY
jgi:hypothetical protein